MNARNRNKPCACGSGVKTKKYCESPAVWQARKEAATEAQRKYIAERAAQRLEEAKLIGVDSNRLRQSRVPLMAAMAAALVGSYHPPTNRLGMF